MDFLQGSAAVLDVENLRKSFRDKRGTVEACKGISLKVSRGEMVGLLGPNGAGKTTTIKCILGLVRPDDGKITVMGVDRIKKPGEAAKNMAAVLEGARNIYWRLTVWENIVYFAGIHGISLKDGKDYFEYLMELLKLADKRRTEVRNLSSGYKQKTALACTLAKMTPIVFLDEPTLGLDVESSYELREALKELQRKEERTIVVSSHDMRVIQDICKRVIIITGGRVVTDQNIDELLDLFRKRSFKISIAANGNGKKDRSSQLYEDNATQSVQGISGQFDCDGLEKELLDSFKEVSLKKTGDTIEITVNFENPMGMYSLFDALRQYNAVIENVTREEFDLEQAFLEIVRKERNNDVVYSA